MPHPRNCVNDCRRAGDASRDSAVEHGLRRDVVDYVRPQAAVELAKPTKGPPFGERIHSRAREPQLVPGDSRALKLRHVLAAWRCYVHIVSGVTRRQRELQTMRDKEAGVINHEQQPYAGASGGRGLV